MPRYKKTQENNSEEQISNETSISSELFDIVTEACLYNKDPVQAIKTKAKKTLQESRELYKKILQHPEFKERMNAYTELEKLTLFSEDRETLLLKLYKIIQEANFEKRYDIVVKTLDRIAKMLSIEDKQMEFKITFSFEPTEKTNIKMI